MDNKLIAMVIADLAYKNESVAINLISNLVGEILTIRNGHIKRKESNGVIVEFNYCDNMYHVTVWYDEYDRMVINDAFASITDAGKFYDRMVKEHVDDVYPWPSLLDYVIDNSIDDFSLRGKSYNTLDLIDLYHCGEEQVFCNQKVISHHSKPYATLTCDIIRTDTDTEER